MKPIFASLLLVVGCAKQSTTTLGAADSQSAGQAMAADVEDSAEGFGPVDMGTSAVPSCITLTGDTSDPDGDSIPTNATLTFACTTTELGLTGTVTGTETVMDTEPDAVAWAFSATANLHGSLTGAGKASIVTDRSGSIVASQATAIGPFELARMLDVTTVLTGAAGQSATVDQTNAWTITYTPTATWTPAGVVVAGSLTATGSWDVTVGSASADATLATPTPLTVTPSCASRITGGVVTGTYADGSGTNTITVTWTGCGVSTVGFATK